MTSQVKTFLGVGDVFPGTTPDLASLKACLATISLTDGLIFCARLNLLISNSAFKEVEVQKLVLQWFFNPAQSQSIWQKSNGFQKNVICMRVGLLELMRWILLWCENKEGDGRTFNDEVVRQDFAKAMMIANQIWIDTTDFAQILTRPVDDLGRELLLLALRRNHEGGYKGHFNPLFWVGFGHSLFCKQKYVQQHYTTLREDFREATGIDIEDYYICKTYLLSNVYSKTLEQIASNIGANNGLFDMNQAGQEVVDSMKPVIRTYLQFESQTIDEMRRNLWKDITDVQTLAEAGSFDPRAILDKPILRIDDGRAIVIDSVYLTERAAVGPLFIISKCERLQRTAQQLIGHFGKAFEDYVSYVFRKIYSTYTNTLGVEMSTEQADADVDVSLKNGKKLVLIEVKSAFLNLNIIYGSSNENYIQELRKKYVNDWGAKQLATAIENLCAGNRVNGIDPNSIERIFPVLLVRDPHMDAGGHPWFLAREFKAKLQPDNAPAHGDISKGTFSIPNLITMTMDELLFLEDSIHRGIDFHQMLSDYTLNHGDRLTSLKDFILINPRYKGRLYEPRTLGLHTYKLIAKTQRRLFTGPPSTPVVVSEPLH